MDDDFTEKTKTFLGWFGNQRTTISPKIQLADLRLHNAGRGIGTPSVSDNPPNILTVSWFLVVTGLVREDTRDLRWPGLPPFL